MRHRFELLGECLREIGILLLVFVPLDAIFYQGAISHSTRLGLVILGIVGLGLIAGGIVVEGKE